MAAERRLDIIGKKLTASERKALREFVDYLRAQHGERVTFVALFGSKARGDSTRDSDVDVLVILAQEDRQLRREIVTQAARISLKYDVLLSPRVIGAERWEEMRGFSLYRNVQREAIPLVQDDVGNRIGDPANG